MSNFLKKYRVPILIIIAVFIIIARKPGNLFNAQFVAEDGKYWFADCYNLGIRCLWLPQDGYLQTVSRAGGLISLAVPFRYSPLAMAILALLIQLLPVVLLLSDRLKQLSPNFWIRAFLALLYILMPNTNGSYLFLTCSQWYLALSAGLLAAFSGKPEWKWFDRFIILLCGLSGPFGILLFPIGLLKWLNTKKKDDLIVFLIIFLTALAQLWLILSFKSTTPRFQGHITWSIKAIYSVLNIQLVWNLLLSPKIYWLLASKFRAWHTIAALLSLPVFFMAAYSFYKNSYQAKLFYLFAFTAGAVGIIFPMGIDRNNLFYNLAVNTEQLRYWLIPMTVILASLVYCAGTLRPTAIKYAGRGYLLILLIGIFFSFRYPSIPDFHFSDYAKQFSVLKPGEKIEIPMFPVPSYWIMDLTKR